MDFILEEWTKQFQKDQELTALNDAEAFEAFAGYCVLSAYHEDDFNPDQFRMGGGDDLGMDVAAVVVNGDLLRDADEVRDAVGKAKQLDVRFVIIQAKRSEKFETKVFTDLADNLVQVFSRGSMTYKRSQDVANLRACVDAVYKDVSKFKKGLPKLSIHYVSTGRPGDGLLEEKRIAAAKRLRELDIFEDVDVVAVGASQLRELYKKASEAVGASFTMPKKLPLPKIPGVEQAFLGVLPARKLVERILTDPNGGIRKVLFYENVRDFQGYNSVNAEIRRTLQDPDRRGRFAVLNNGITIVARELTTTGEEVHIRDFQIVNGCQTCHVLFDQRESLSDGVHVNVRLIQSNDEDVIGGIIAATNRQTAVTEDDLAARESFHKKLEDFFAAQPESRRLYYERRSRQYSGEASVERTRVITRPQLTKAYAAMILNEPAGTGRYARLKSKHEKMLFQPNHDPLVYYTTAAAFYRLEWLFRNKRAFWGYRAARHHLLAALKVRLVGTGSLPPGAGGKNICDKILRVVWHPLESEHHFAQLLTVVVTAQVEEEKERAGVQLSDLVRTERFAERVRRGALELAS
ncbi:AIPR family protein [Micromonospora sp. 4G57]|uniref:AIPR family protein n=1 Tax=Micromonospora sicca TaxID=2202420 RepID=A0ABU5JNV6_9ACTN|nr:MULTISPECIES: AIPR family protein [unclassified Micromonospora]MDZ5447594.1 AIPR family protein [Micromonospora sp. 4G57]MDZ5494334.1 AIPR family protein [Micromonospora sp. 4G53]